jgi:hypothetical protein
MGIETDSLKRLGWPICAVCQKRVEVIHTIEDLLLDCHLVIAECHGSREEVRLDKMDVANGKVRLDGFAFRKEVMADDKAIGGGPYKALGS